MPGTNERTRRARGPGDRPGDRRGVPASELPEVHTALTVDLTLEGESTTITCEVAQHIGDSIVRTIALKPTDGLVRGTPVKNTGSPITVPVGRACSATSTT